MKDKILNKIKEFCKKYYKLALFILIFSVFVFLFNQNSQTLNYYLKRGTVLEYSLSKLQNVDEEKIDDFLLKLNLKYSFVDETKSVYPFYDKYGKPIENRLTIAIPVLINSENTKLFNSISDYVFKQYPESKLINLKSMGYQYDAKYRAFLNFLSIFCLTFFVWVLILYLFSKQGFFENIKNKTISFFKEQKQNLTDFFKKTKEKGMGYFFKRLLLDSDETKEENVAKETINTIIFVIVMVILIRFFIGELRWIPSGSMRPTILEHDRVFVEKLEHPHRNIKRGDILVFYPPEVQLSNSFFAVFARLSGIFCKDMAYIKRVVGMPNDKFEVKYLADINEYRVYINDEPLNEPYINSSENWTPCVENMYCGPFIIPEKNYFMMGDNRGNSQDSRFWGFLKEERVIGRANFMFLPIRRINFLKDKYFTLDEQIKNNKKVEKLFILDRY